MRGLLLGSALAAVLAGCAAAVPFPAAAPVELGDADPRAVAERFRQDVPDDFHLLSSIVFEYNWSTVAGLGILDINTREGRYKVVCMNDLGVKLFEFAGDRNGLTHQYVIEPLAKHGNLAATVGEDIKRIYLDMTPAADAVATKRRHSVLFRQWSGEGTLEYEFAGEGLHLVRKTYREGFNTIWQVSYYEHARKNGKIYPLGVILVNYRYGYRLIVRQKEIRD